ncbi:uncharacterized protein [Miscanthus floridulus]|uniref:uncharacterized protein n=1 Tax=Miscanthus floridulus TaxID=154761 RepID=UPI003458F068
MGVGQADDPGRRWHGRALQVAGSAVARSTTAVACGGRGMLGAPRGESGSTGAGGTAAAVEAGGGGRQGGAKPRRGEGAAWAQEPTRGPGRERRGAGRGAGSQPRATTRRGGVGSAAVGHGSAAVALGGLGAAVVALGGSGRGGAARARAAAAKLDSALLGRERKRKRGAGPIGNEGSAPATLVPSSAPRRQSGWCQAPYCHVTYPAQELGARDVSSAPASMTLS